jgi:outer membrane protein, multidrug efflux system
LYYYIEMNKHVWIRAGLTAGLALVLAGCKLGPDYARPEVDLPAQLRAGGRGDASFADKTWDSVFSDRVLHGLIQEALANNQDLVAATYRIEEAAAMAGIARAEFFPFLGGEGSASRTRSSLALANQSDIDAKIEREQQRALNQETEWQRDDAFRAQEHKIDLARETDPVRRRERKQDFERQTAARAKERNIQRQERQREIALEMRPPNPHSNRFSLGAVLTYEVDLWGRIRRSSEAARAAMLASEYARAAVQTGLIAAVAAAYVDLRTYDGQLQIARRTLDSRRKSLGLVEERAKQGVTSDLEVGQAEVLLRQAEVAIPQTEQQIALAENLLNFLLGRTSGTIARGRPIEALDGRIKIAGGLPSALLERRPDVLAAEQQLVALNANIGVAKAAYFPTLSITGTAGVTSADIDNLLKKSATTWSVAPALSVPIFTAGATGFGVKAAEAKQREAVAAYRSAIQLAFQESADALSGYLNNGRVVERQRQLVDALAKVARLAATRYEGGASSYLEVLDAERALFDGELALAEARRQRLQSVVAAYRALGGGWSR